MAASSRNRLWVAALLAVAWAPARGESGARPLSQCIRQNWTYRDGLPHNVVHRLLVASSGYLWLGTQEGLVRFDGVRFKVFAQLETPGLAGNEISALVEDDRGVMWIGTSNGLSRLRDDAFDQVDLGGDAAVSALAPDGEGGVWVATEASGVRHVHAGEPGRVERIAGLPDERITTLVRSGDALWIGGYGGLARLASGRLEVLGTAGLGAEVVRTMLEGRDGTVWVGTPTGLVRRRPGAVRFEHVPLPVPAVVYALLEDREGALWIGAGSGPLLRMAGERVDGLPAAGGGPFDIHVLAEDGEGSLWAGTETGGLYRLRWGPALTIGTEEGLAADVVWAVRQGRDGAMWIASDGGLDRFAAGRVERAHARELGGAGLAALFEDRAGDLWVGTESAGLFRFGPRGAVRYGRESGLGGLMVRTIHQDARGRMWVGTTQGLFRMEGARFEMLVRGPDLPGDKVNTIAELPDGSLWVGTTTGLARVDGDRLVSALAGGQRIRSDVTALRPEPDGSLWIGTVGEGLARLSGGRLERWTRREGLHEDTVLAILDDGAGQLWFSGNHGITRVRRTQLEEVAAGRRAAVDATVFGTADGMRERECNGGIEPAAWRSTDGWLWFATIRGAVAIDPSRVQASPTPPRVRIEELVVDGRLVPAAELLRFAPGTRRVDVRYTGLALTAADRVRFRHRLVGLESAFFDAGQDRVAHYTNLPPGKYVFQVAAASASGSWSQPASFGFEIRPAVWQTSWFALACALAVVGLAAGVHLARTSVLRRREAELAARVEEEMRRVKVLTGLLPTCAWCKRIRDDAGNWHPFEAYVTARTDATFTHGMCPECYARSMREHGEE